MTLILTLFLLLLALRFASTFIQLAIHASPRQFWRVLKHAAFLAFRSESAAFSCPTSSVIAACDMPQFLVSEAPRFDEEIIRDLRPTDGWLMNVSTGTVPMGTPTEITQDRFRAVYPNITKTWTPVVSTGCLGSPCNPVEHQIGWGADRLTYYEQGQSWGTPLICYDQAMNVTHAVQHISQIIEDILRPATTTISSNFLRKSALFWAKKHHIANSLLSEFTYQWTLGGVNLDEEIYFDTNAAPTNIFKLVPQMLQHRFEPLMRIGYGGKNPFAETSPFIELVTDMDTVWDLDHLGGQQGVGGTDSPNVLGNWRFTNFAESTKYWRYGFNGQIGNFMTRTDMEQLRFNFVGDLLAGANGGNGNRYRYQVVLPYVNSITTGAGGQAGIGDDENPAYQNAQFRLTFIWHKKGMELLVPEAAPLNPEMPFAHRDFGGKWQFVMDNLGADQSGVVIENKRRNKGQFIADFKYFVRPMHTEFVEVFFHKGEQFCIPEILPCNDDPGYPVQTYTSELPGCPVPSAFTGIYSGGVPTGVQTPQEIPVAPPAQDGPVPQPPAAIPANSPDL